MRASGPLGGPNGLGLLLLYMMALGPMLTCVSAWDATDMELFDLVEEVQRNFYDVLGVDQAAPPAEIRKAYRRMSLLLHPDKNKQDNAETLFRQLVAIYDVLKDEDKRGRYDTVLQNGLPDWRDTVFYIRRVRKMGLTEFSLLLFLILTVGHYLVAWSVYLERRFELQEVFTKRRKEKKRRFTKSEVEEDIIETLPEEVRRLLVKPTMSDLLPCILCRQFLLLLRSLPSLYQDCVHCYQSWKKRKDSAEAPCPPKDATEEKRQPRQRRSRLEAIPELGGKEGIWGGPRAPLPLDAPAFDDLERQVDDWLQEKPAEHRNKDQEWTEEDGSRLARLMVKFPGGTPGRWERIAHELGRSVAQVTTKAKQVKESISLTSGLTKLSTLKSVPAATSIEETATNHSECHTEADVWRTEGSGGNAEKLNDGEPGESDRDEGGREAAGKREGASRRRRPKGGNPAERVAPPADGAGAERQRGRRQRDFLEEEDDDAEEERPGRSGEPTPVGAQIGGGSTEAGPAWSQNQQKLLELALQQFPRGTAERWEKIAKCVPGKTKDDCTNRYKLLAELVKKRKQQN